MRAARQPLFMLLVLADELINLECWCASARAAGRVKAGRRIVFFSRREAPAAVQQAVAAGDAVLLPRPSRGTRPRRARWPTRLHLLSRDLEGFGIPVLEAMACGAPVIASDRGVIPEALAAPACWRMPKTILPWPRTFVACSAPKPSASGCGSRDGSARRNFRGAAQRYRY